MREPIITVMNIAAGPQGTLETLRIMAGLARNASQSPVFKQFTGIFKDAHDVDFAIRPRYEYTPEPVETLFAPEYNLAYFIDFGKVIGDCDDIAMFYAAIFYAMGIPCRFVAMKTKRNNPDYFHVVVEAFEQQRWKRFDPTVTPGLVQYDYGQMIVNV